MSERVSLLATMWILTFCARGGAAVDSFAGDVCLIAVSVFRGARVWGEGTMRLVVVEAEGIEGPPGFVLRVNSICVLRAGRVDIHTAPAPTSSRPMAMPILKSLFM